MDHDLPTPLKSAGTCPLSPQDSKGTMLLLASSKATEVNDILIFNDPQYNSWILAVLFAEVSLVILVPVGTLGLQSVFGVQDSLVAQW